MLFSLCKNIALIIEMRVRVWVGSFRAGFHLHKMLVFLIKFKLTLLGLGNQLVRFQVSVLSFILLSFSLDIARLSLGIAIDQPKLIPKFGPRANPTRAEPTLGLTLNHAITQFLGISSS